MSKYYVCSSQMTDVDCIKGALEDLGVPLDAIITHETPVELRDYHNRQFADIVIGKGTLKTSHDIGFRKRSDGTYDVMVYDGDSWNATAKRLLPTARGGTGELAQHYSKRVILKTAKKKYGHRAKVTEKDGRIKIKIGVS